MQTDKQPPPVTSGTFMGATPVKPVRLLGGSFALRALIGVALLTLLSSVDLGAGWGWQATLFATLFLLLPLLAWLAVSALGVRTGLRLALLLSVVLLFVPGSTALLLALGLFGVSALWFLRLFHRHASLTALPRAACFALALLLITPLPEMLLGFWLYSTFGVFATGAQLSAWAILPLQGHLASAALGAGLLGSYHYAFEGILSWIIVTLPLSATLFALVFLYSPARVRHAFVEGLTAPAQEQPAQQQLQEPETPTQEQSTQPVAHNEGSTTRTTSASTDSPLQFQARKARYNLSKIIGAQALKDGLIEAVEDFQASDGNGILLSGDPGNGKTHISECLAGHLGWNFLEVRTSELSSMWTGETAMRVAQIFKDARAQAPVVILIDEADSFLVSRSGMVQGSPGGADQNNLATANTFLTEVASLNAGFNEHRVLVIAATNYLDKLDAAAMREGRFDRKIVVPPPNFELRTKMLFESLPPDLYRGRIERDEVDGALRRWEGWSIARVKAVGKHAAKMLRKNPDARLDAQLLRDVLDLMSADMGTRLPEDALSLDDLVMDEPLEQGLRELATLLDDPDMLGRRGISMPRGAIFYGPPGTGKTAAGQALAKQLKCRFLATTGGSLLADPKQVQDLVKKARDCRPCIIFIDEAEGVLRERSGNPVGQEVTNMLLEVMDGPQRLHDVFFIAATNFADDLDAAVTRAGRLSEHFDFAPSDETLRAFVQAQMNRHKNVNWIGMASDLLERHPGLHQAGLKGCIDAALRKAVVRLGAKSTQTPTLDLREI